MGTEITEKSRNRPSNNKISFSGIYIFVITLLMYVPVILTVFYSFNESKISSVWGGFSLKWYRELFNDKSMLKAVGNSVILALSSAFAANLIGISAAIGGRRRKSRADGIISFGATLPIMIPEIILGMAFLALFSFMGAPFGMFTLLIAHTSFCIPYVYMTVKARLADMDESIEEAARDLGASGWRIFWDITFPSILPAVLSGSLLAFAMSFDDVVISIFVTGPKTDIMAVKIYTRLKTGVTPEINALATVLLSIIIIILAVCRLTVFRNKKQG